MKLTLLSIKQVQERIPYSATHLWRLERNGKFPRRVKIGPGRVGWLSDEIDEWIESKSSNRMNSDNQENSK